MKCIKKSQEVTAVQYQGCINQEIESILSGKDGLYFFHYNDLYIYDEQNKPELVNQDDIIIQTNTGLLKVMNEAEFNQLYIEIQ